MVRQSLKRSFDLIVVIALAPLAVPLLAIGAVVSVLETKSSPIFRHPRVGHHGTPFHVFKLRTIRPASADPDVLGITLPGDARIGRFSRLLRATKVDELPQLLNVLRGQMSIVGPRPETPRMLALLDQETRDRVLSVRPGLTSPASVLYAREERVLAASADPRETAIELFLRKTELNAIYSQEWTLLGDVAIVFRTIVGLIFPNRATP